MNALIRTRIWIHRHCPTAAPNDHNPLRRPKFDSIGEADLVNVNTNLSSALYLRLNSVDKVTYAPDHPQMRDANDVARQRGVSLEKVFNG